ncbi:hypothetical protein L6R52_03725 [Myxococcota bacterium]|nr:hypothetical protein [Myxococcota bacterium]
MTTPHTEVPDGFVGRSAELGALRARISSGARLVTITGTGGVGKTRLLSELVAALTGELGPERVLAVDLVEARSTFDVCASVARALQVPLSAIGDDEAARVVGAALVERRIAILALDNYEQLLPAAASLPGEWSAASEHLHVVTTSRVRLGVDGEEVLALPPLSTRPTDGALSDAAWLFVRNVLAARPSLGEPPGLREVAESVAERLDGIPLALELAAARATLLSPRQVLERLDQGLAILADRRRDRQSKQATMRAAVAWSWELLEAHERDALAACSIFRGGFSLEAAEAIVDVPRGTTVIDVLESLHERSLLNVVDADGLEGEARFRQYVVIRDFGHDALVESGRLEATRARRDEYFSRVGLDWAERARGHGGARYLVRIRLERENLVAIVTDRGDTSDEPSPAALAAVLALAPWMLRAEVATLAALCARVFDGASRPPQPSRPWLRARLVWVGALRITAERERARALAEEVLSFAGDDLELRAEALLHLGDCAISAGRHAEAAKILAEGLGLAERSAMPALEARLRASLGSALAHTPAIDRAFEELEHARALALRLGDDTTAAMLLRSIGHVHSERGELVRARETLELAERTARELGDKLLESLAVSDLALVLAQEHRFEDAAEYYQRGLGMHRELGNRRYEAFMLAYRGLMLQWLDRLDDARDQMEGALVVLRRTGDLRTQGLVLGRLATVAADGGRVELAEDYLARSRVLTEQEGHRDRLVLLTVHEGHLELARARRAFDRGDVAETIRLRHSAAARAQAPKTSADGSKPLIERSDDARLAVALLERRLAEVPAPTAGLLVTSDGELFRAPDGTFGDLGRRQVLRRLLAALIDARRSRPGEPVSTEVLLDAGWPGEQIARRAAKNRLYVALTTLRGLGLRGLVVNAGDGWMLDPEVELVLVPRDSFERPGA